MTNTLGASADAIQKYRHDPKAALEWQVRFLHKHLPFDLYAREAVEGKERVVLIAGWYASKDEIRKTLRLYPRSEFMLRYRRWDVELPDELPLSFDLAYAREFKKPFRNCMWMPNGSFDRAGTTLGYCSDSSGSVPTAAEALKKFGHLRVRKGTGDAVDKYVKTDPGKEMRSDIVWAIASTVAGGGASPNEMEAIVRSSRAFDAKRSEYGDNYSEPEIRRLRRKLYVSRWN